MSSSEVDIDEEFATGSGAERIYSAPSRSPFGTSLPIPLQLRSGLSLPFYAKASKTDLRLNPLLLHYRLYPKFSGNIEIGIGQTRLKSLTALPLNAAALSDLAVRSVQQLPQVNLLSPPTDMLIISNVPENFQVRLR